MTNISERLGHGCTNPRRQFGVTAKFCTPAPNTCGGSYIFGEFVRPWFRSMMKTICNPKVLRNGIGPTFCAWNKMNEWVVIKRTDGPSIRGPWSDGFLVTLNSTTRVQCWSTTFQFITYSHNTTRHDVFLHSKCLTFYTWHITFTYMKLTHKLRVFRRHCL